MKRGMTRRAALLIIPAILLAGILALHGPGMRIVFAAESGTPQPAPQAAPVLPAPPGAVRGRLPVEQPRSMSGMAGMPGMRGQTATKTEPAPPGYQTQSTIGPGNTQMQPMGAMGTRSMDQGLTMREVLYILSIQDALQVMAELLAIQEKLIAGPKGLEKEQLQKELTQIKERVRRITGDYREVMSGQLRGE
jgi:hypothetical protein